MSEKTKNLRTTRRKSLSKRLIIPVVIMIMLFLAGVGVAVYVLKQIKVREIVFINNSQLKKDDLIYITKVRVGDGLLDFSNKELYTFAKKSPWIKELVVRKELSGSIFFNIKEATPVAALKLNDDFFLVSQEGVVLEQLKDSNLFLPIIDNIHPSSNATTYAEAINIINMLAQKGLMQYDGSFVVFGKRPEDLSLNTGKMIIKIGSGDLEDKFKRLILVRDEIDKRSMSVDYIDLRFAGRVIVKSPNGKQTDIH